MNYGFIKDGIITAPVAMCSIFNGVGAWHTLSDEERAEHGWYVCEVVNESVNALKESRSELPELAFDGEKITAVYTVIEKSLETIKTELLAALAAYRFKCEVGGLTLGGGVNIATDRESKSQLNKTYVELKNGLIPDTDWKCTPDWQLRDLAQFEPIAKALAAHDRGCFRSERLVQGMINDAVDIPVLEMFNIGNLFDAAYQEAYAEVMTPEQAPE